LVVSDTIYVPPSFNVGFTTGSKIRNISGFLANIDVENGDLGAITSINDFIINTFFESFNAITDTGDLRAADAVSLGFALGRDATTNGLTFTSPAQFGALRGSVGMIRSTGTAEDADTTLFNTF